MRTSHRVVDPDVPPERFNGRCVLALMTKAPRAGEVKTRLVPPLTNEEAAQLNKCFLQDTASAISACCSSLASPNPGRPLVRGVAVYTPVGAEPDYADILPADFNLLPQRGKDFGERLYLAAEDLFRCGFGSVCLIDSDSPTVPAENFAKAADLLSLPGNDIVLGPCDDGGYYLIGLKQTHRELFDGIDWSTERVFEQTLRRAAEIGVEVKILPTGYDVDDRGGLRRLCDELLAEGALDGLAPQSQKFLRRIIEREGRSRIWPV
jgi:uncharacterized protein